MATQSTRVLGGIVAFAAVFVAFQFVLFDPKSIVPSAKVVFEFGFLVVVFGALLLVPSLSVDEDVALPLVIGLGAFFVRSTTDITDELLQHPLLFSALFEEGLMVLGFAFLFVGLRREAAIRDEREARLGERERRLREQNDRLETFASVLSHDLRNPLQVATGRVEMARRDAGDDDRHVDTALDALGRMDELIADVLLLVRTDAEGLETTTVSLESVARDAWSTVETRDATLTVAADPAVQADASLLRQLFENLFRNCVEHGSTSGRASPDDSVVHGDETVAVEVGQLADGHGFYIADDGPGIPPDKREDVFETGHSGGNGTGLGLAIVREIVRAHGWTVHVTESEASGARFEIRTDAT